MSKPFPLRESELTYWIFRASQLGELVSIERMTKLIEDSHRQDFRS